MLIGAGGGVGRFDKVLAIDLTTRNLLWSVPVGIGGLGGTYGQFPLASTSDGTPLLIASTLEGIVYGFALH